MIGHRGASAHETENTVEAFARARRDNADGVELDVLLCRTGEVVVFHDDTLDRVAGRPGLVGRMPWSELRDVPLPGATRIPTLDMAFEACGPDLLVNVELKATGPLDRAVPALVRAVSVALLRTGAAARVIVSSFSPVAVGLWRLARPDVAAALLFEAAAPLPLRKGWATPVLRPMAVHPEHVLCTPDRVARWHAAGYAVNTWTVDDPNRLRALAAAGIDGLITNDPAAALSSFRTA